MRKAFIDQLIHFAELDPTVYLIVGDVGFSFIEPFVQKFPTRYINAGVAEQNAIGMAAGLAMAGKNVFVYSIIPFVTMRPFEQIKVDLCYQNLPVKIVGVGGGFGYGALGGTHHSIEDVAVMRALPGMTVVTPANGHEMSELMPHIMKSTGPVYCRIARAEENDSLRYEAAIRLGIIAPLIPAEEHILLTSGHMLDVGFRVCNQLKEAGISLGLYSVHTIKPLDIHFFSSLGKNIKSIFTLEEHSVIGGLGEAVSRAVCENVAQKVNFKSFAVNDRYEHVIGDSLFLRELSGLGADSVTKAIVDLLQAV